VLGKWQIGIKTQRYFITMKHTKFISILEQIREDFDYYLIKLFFSACLKMHKNENFFINSISESGFHLAYYCAFKNSTKFVSIMEFQL